MSPFLFLCLAFLLSLTPSSARHVIHINSTMIEFSSLAWDPVARHFVAGSTLSPAVYGIPDAGTVNCIISQPNSSDNSGVSATAVAVDHIRQRLIVTFSNHSSVTVYDLKSYKSILTIPLPELDSAPGGIAMDLETGDVFVSSTSRGIVLKVGQEGNQTNAISEFKIPDNQGLGGLVRTNHGYIITVQPTTNKLWRVDSKNGTVKEIMGKDGTNPLSAVGHVIALRTNSSIVVATNDALRSIECVDDSWEQASFTDKLVKLGDGETVVAVAMRDDAAYALIKLQEGYRIEEVLWGRPSHGWRWYMLFIGFWLTMFFYCSYVGWDAWQRWLYLRKHGPTPQEDLFSYLFRKCFQSRKGADTASIDPSPDFVAEL